MRSSISRCGIVSVALVITACSGNNEEDVAREDPASQSPAAVTWVSDLAAIANAVEQQPGAADSILRAHDMTRAAFDSLIYDVAADADLAAQFEGERNR